MIHYQLLCATGHEFDGWFKNSTSFARQRSRNLLECPNCGTHDVTQALMAPRIGGRAKPGRTIDHDPTPADAKPPTPPPSTAVAGRMPAEVRALLARVRQEVETRCDYVGPNFATEARRIHEGEAQARGIYGEATEAEAEALEDDGINVGRIPWVPRADS